MSTLSHRQLAEEFHQLHRDFLVLPNAWDPPSARLVAAAGAPAVATTSAGISWSRGVADAGGLDRDTALDAARRVVRSVAVPVTLDIEDGYGDEESGVEATVNAVIEMGAAGINIEDSRAGSQLTPAEFTAILQRVTHHVQQSRIRVFVNARVDTYLANRGRPADELLADAVRRARAYEDAGADGVFVPGVADHQAITTLADSIRVPLNVMVGPNSGALADLAALGVRRVSAGPALTTAAYGEVGRWAREMLDGSLAKVPTGAHVDDIVAAGDTEEGQS